MSQAGETCLCTAPGRRLADEWALVLVSQGLSPTLRRTAGGYALLVPAEQAERAAAALADYVRETRDAPRERPAPVWEGRGPLAAGLSISGALLAFFRVTGPWTTDSPWFARGAAEAGRILSGEPWRALTALTLHADAAHVFANALAGTLFFTAALRLLGPGLGAALVLLAGVGGNLLNALLHGSGHVSVGASTAVFGAVGLLGGFGIVRRRLGGMRGRRAWIPVAASLALLGILGTGGERTDLWAHGFGLGVGAALGVALAPLVRRPPGLAAQLALGGLALAAVIGGWALVL